MNPLNATVLGSFGERLSKIEQEVDNLLEKPFYLQNPNDFLPDLEFIPATSLD